MVIYGWRRYVQVLAVLTLVCQQCARPAEHVLRRLTTKFTLFFVPLFPISRVHLLTCGACHGEFKIKKEQAAHLAASATQQLPPQPYAGPPQPAYGQQPSSGQPGPQQQPPYPGPGYHPPQR